MRFALFCLRTGFCLLAAFPLACQAAYHTSPACWSQPRVVHRGPPSAEFANRLRLIETAALPANRTATAAPGGAARFWVRQPDTSQPGPWHAAVVVERGDAPSLSLLVEDSGGLLYPRWLTERLLFLRIQWGRSVFSDVLLDVHRGSLPYHEAVEDGSIAFEQYRAACGADCGCATGDNGTDDLVAAEAAMPVPAAIPGPDALIGLLVLPGIFGPPESGGVVPAAESRPLAIHAEPDSAEPVLRLSAMSAFEHREYTYEGAAAVVYQQQSGWYQIGLRDQAVARGWVRAGDGDEFHPIESLLLHGLSYLNTYWDGHLWGEAGGGQRSARASPLIAAMSGDDNAEIAVQILDTRWVEGGLWLQIETLDASPCLSASPKVVDRGWIPAYAASGELVAGYYSRGC